MARSDVDKVARAIRYLDENCGRQPGLAEVVGALVTCSDLARAVGKPKAARKKMIVAWESARVGGRRAG